MSVKIKPLEWRQWYFDDQVTILQASFGGLYQVRIREGVVWVDWPDRPATEYATIDAAKAAAQADYEARVRRALLPDSTIADLVKALEPFDAILDIFEQPAGCRPKSGDIMSWEDHRVGKRDLTVEMLRTARAALLKARGETK